MLDKDTVFRSDSGKLLVMDVGLTDNHLFSPDGTTLYEVYGSPGASHYSPGHLTERGHFEVPTLDLRGAFLRTDDTLTWRDELYVLTDKVFDRRSATVVPLPDVRQPEYLAFSDDPTIIIYVSASRYAYSYGSFRLFVIDDGGVHEAKHLSVTRWRDGGTTIIDCEEGNFFSPSPFTQDAKATWSTPFLKITLSEIPRSEIAARYNIVEDAQGALVSVRAKI